MQDVGHLVARHQQAAEQELRQHERRHELHGLELGGRERADEQTERHAEQRVQDGDDHQQPGGPATSRPRSVTESALASDCLDDGDEAEGEP